jgi:multidrug efflux system membrane fusion protein
VTTRRTLLAIALAAALLTAACGGGDAAQEVEFRVPVTVRDVGTADVEDRVVVTGTLRAPETVSLRAETSGTLRLAKRADGRRLVEGDRVQAGAVIAEITGEDVRLASRLDATRQRYEAAQRDHESAKRLHAEGLTSELELRNAETVLADAKLEWERSRLTEDRSRLVTPISGVILRLGRDDSGQPVGEGQLVAQGYEVARIAPIDALIADVDLVGPDVARVEPGMPARVRHHAWDDRRFDGRVLRLAPALDPTTRTLRAEIATNNQERLLRPGMFVEVSVVTERREGVPVVPREAVTERGGTKVVFVLDGQKVAQRDVVPGLGDDDVVEIREGLSPGDRVVVRGLETLTDGTRVRVTGA